MAIARGDIGRGWWQDHKDRRYSDRSWADNEGFRAWGPKRLMDPTREGGWVCLAGGGGDIVEGRSRGGGKRSKPER